MEFAKQPFDVNGVGITLSGRVDHQLHARLVHPDATERHRRRHVGVRREQARRLAGAAFSGMASELSKVDMTFRPS